MSYVSDDTWSSGYMRSYVENYAFRARCMHQIDELPVERKVCFDRCHGITCLICTPFVRKAIKALFGQVPYLRRVPYCLPVPWFHQGKANGCKLPLHPRVSHEEPEFYQ